jgi:tetratricopeptide (TPR) repeat protein
MRAKRWAGRGLVVAAVGLLGACGGPRFQGAEYPETVHVERAPSKAPAPVAVLLFRMEYRLDENGGFTRTQRHRYRVLTQQGVESWGSTEARWSPWYMERPQITATVTSPSGEEIKLDPSTISESAAYPEMPDVYSDSKLLRAPLPHVAIGSVVEEVIVTRTKRPFFGDGYAHHALLQRNVAEERAELDIDLPEGAPFHYEVLDAKVKIEDTRAGGRRHLLFTGGPYEAISPVEPMAPSEVPRWPEVVFGTGTSWQSLVESYAQLVEEKLSGPGLVGVAEKVVQPSDSPKVKADKLLAWMWKRVRYAGIEFGESAITPQAPSETLKRGYGDCKDQAALLVGLLRDAGVPSRVALLKAGDDNDDVRKDLPALNVFDHAIVVIPGDVPVWIDPTADHTRAGELPWPDQDRLALVIDDGTRELTRTPAGDAKQNTYREARTVYLPELGKARIVEAWTATGTIESALREGFAGVADDAQKGFLQYIGTAYNSQNLGAFEVSPVPDLATPFHVRVEANDAGVALTNLTSAEVIIDPDVMFGWVPGALAQGEERRGELVLAAPYDSEVRYEVHPPEGFVAAELPALKNAVVGPATLDRALQVRPDGVVELRFHFTLPKRRWAAAEVTAFRKAYSALREEPHQRVKFVHEGLKHHQERHPEKELAAYRRYVKAHPEGGVHTMRLAAGLADLGFGTSARRLAEQAVKQTADNASLFTVLGDIEQRDTLGRTLHRGYNRAEAIAAYREAVELDPDDMDVQIQIATLLEHNAAGEHYGDGSQLTEAVAHYDAISPEQMQAYENGRFGNNVLFALMYAGRFDELRARLAKLSRERVPEVVSIISAAVSGPTAALAEVVRLDLPAASRSQTLEAAARVLMTLRKYPEASALTDAAAEGSSDVALRVRAGVQRKLRMIDVAKMPVAKPEELVTKAFALFMAQPDTAEAQARSYVSARAFNKQGKATALDMLKALALGSTHRPLPPAAMADSLLASTSLSVDGSAAVGFRVTMRSDFVSNNSTQAFVAHDAGGYRIRAFNSDPSDLGCEALHLVKGAEKKPAAQWLDWAHDLLSSSGGEDPLRVDPFSRLWVEGKGDIELAAAALCAQGSGAELAVPVLEAARAKATSDQKSILEHALALAYSNLDRPKDVLAVATGLEKTLPRSMTVRMMVIRAMLELEQYDAVRAKVTQHLAKDPENIALLSVLADVEVELGHVSEARRIDEKLIATGKAGAWVYNNAAWRSLQGGGPVTDKDLGYALKAAQAEPNDGKVLNTLAALNAELGRVEDARETLMKAIASHPDGDPSNADWYVVGRIAEQLSLPDEAKAAYARAVSSGKGGRDSVYQLAQKRLKGIK